MQSAFTGIRQRWGLTFVCLKIQVKNLLGTEGMKEHEEEGRLCVEGSRV